MKNIPLHYKISVAFNNEGRNLKEIYKEQFLLYVKNLKNN